MQVVVGHHGSDDQGVAVGVMNEVNIIIAKGDVVVFPLEVFYRPPIQVVDISEQPLPCFLGIAVSGLARLSIEMRSAKDSLDLAMGLRFRTVILRSHPSVIDIVLQVPATDELLYLIFEGDALSVVWPISLWNRQYLLWFLLE